MTTKLPYDINVTLWLFHLMNAYDINTTNYGLINTKYILHP